MLCWICHGAALRTPKIGHLLDQAGCAKSICELEIDIFSNCMSRYFGSHPESRCRVDKVDFYDDRNVTGGYRHNDAQNARRPIANQ